MTSKRQLVVIESGVGEATEGRLFALDPKAAEGIGIPTMIFVATLPAAGTLKGQMYYNTVSHLSYVWDGVIFQPLTPSIITSFDTDTLLLANTTLPVGQYASAKDTGNLYVKVATGWRQVGTHMYNTAAQLLADTPASGSQGIALDENSFWLYVGGQWIAQTTRVMADLAAINLWTPPDGARAFAQAEGTALIRSGGAWVSAEPITDTEANIMAMDLTLLPLGQLALATDTGRSFVLNDAGAGILQWSGSPVMHFATDALLLASTPADGIIAFADDTGNFYGRALGAWTSSSGSKINVLTDAAPAPPLAVKGDLIVRVDGGGLPIRTEVYDGAVWQRSTNKITVGATNPVAPQLYDINYFDGSSYSHAAYWTGTAWKAFTSTVIVKENAGGISSFNSAIGYQTGPVSKREPTLWIKSNQDVLGGWFKIDRLWETSWGVIAHQHDIPKISYTIADKQMISSSAACRNGRRYKITYQGLTSVGSNNTVQKVQVSIKAGGSHIAGAYGFFNWNGGQFDANSDTNSFNIVGIYNCTANAAITFSGWADALVADGAQREQNIIVEDVGPTSRSAMA